MTHAHVEKLEKHASQVDAAKGFGGKYGVQTDRVDKSAVSWAHKEAAQKHASQQGTFFRFHLVLVTDRFSMLSFAFTSILVDRRSVSQLAIVLQL